MSATNAARRDGDQRRVIMRFAPNSRIRLTPERDDVYGVACAGPTQAA